MRYHFYHFLLLALLLMQVAATMCHAAETSEIVCIQCHGAMTDRLGAPVIQWRKSIHSENGIACNSCHGGDPNDAVNAMNPERGFLGAPKEREIPGFCGRCHVGVLKDYLASAHGKVLGKGGPTCVTCHGNHSVLKASLDLINEKNCGRCHSFERAQHLHEAMQETEKMIGSIENDISRYKLKGIDTEKLEKDLFAIRNTFHTLFHNVDVGMVKQESGKIKSDLHKIQTSLQQIKDADYSRKIIGACVVSAMLVTALLLHLLQKTYKN